LADFVEIKVKLVSPEKKPLKDFKIRKAPVPESGTRTWWGPVPDFQRQFLEEKAFIWALQETIPRRQVF
jgi:hypothetical protein